MRCLDCEWSAECDIKHLHWPGPCSENAAIGALARIATRYRDRVAELQAVLAAVRNYSRAGSAGQESARLFEIRKIVSGALKDHAPASLGLEGRQ